MVDELLDAFLGDGTDRSDASVVSPSPTEAGSAVIHTPLNRRLAGHLPAGRPHDITVHTWTMLRQVAMGTSVTDLARDQGLPFPRLRRRIEVAARNLGYEGAGPLSWLTANGRLAPHAVVIDSDTGCWIWTGKLRARDAGPCGLLPPALRPLELASARTAQRPVRQYLSEREHGPIPVGWAVRPTCGDRRCVNPDHGEARPKRDVGCRSDSMAVGTRAGGE